MTTFLKQCHVFDLGLIDFISAQSIQKEKVSFVRTEGRNVLILCEHTPVLTLGRSAQQNSFLTSPEKIQEQGVPIIRVDRGGEVTFHGPGQLIVYPIFYLSKSERDLNQFLRKLEEVIIDLLKFFGIVANRLEGFTGVWVKGKKIASVGLGVKKWVTYHGIGLNVNTDLRFFSFIKPCGLDVAMTSIEQELGCPASMPEVKRKIVELISVMLHQEMIGEPDGKRN